MNVELPNRKKLRLQNYDYSRNGCYFVTVCTHERQNLFGVIQNGKIQLNEIGEIVDFTWNDLINHNRIKSDQYVIMPNHVHGIIEICDYSAETTKHHAIPEIVRQFKSFSTKRINELLRRNGYEPFATGAMWQKSYYEHIIRDDRDYYETAKYIENNPLKWELDKYYQQN